MAEGHARSPSSPWLLLRLSAGRSVAGRERRANAILASASPSRWPRSDRSLFPFDTYLILLKDCMMPARSAYGTVTPGPTVTGRSRPSVVVPTFKPAELQRGRHPLLTAAPHPHYLDVRRHCRQKPANIRTTTWPGRRCLALANRSVDRYAVLAGRRPGRRGLVTTM